MKKATLLIIVMLLAMTALFAEEKGVTLISSPGSSNEKGTLEDMKIGQEVKVDNFGKITITEVKEVDVYSFCLGSWSSGPEEDYIILLVDILNTNKQAYDYLKKCSVTAYYDDGYEFSGWAGQYDWSKAKDYIAHQITAIKPMYAGHYGFYITLPNSVLEDTAPLKIIVKMDDVEFTYYVRK